ncbi:OB-fold nucleic acid binding domain-containing protein [Geomonas sp. RF6]|uniref:OB-fold nucleic acid binding domain-containing protein n=1 Tax=Geomonas sp. RF6 TaxID=2897342 RepID=UPI001E5CED8C|nr:OB-fold nucleic acid binding domain-containing protein [Geomonas sp. RF6]UFS68891.1 OB-fold nucleic acid binding domain-containing protein [Geomonas sp. RF6]
MTPSRTTLCLLFTAFTLTTAPLALAGAEAPATVNGKPLPQSIPLSGKVAETMDGGGYTYILLKQSSGEKVWVAIPQMKISVGQEVSLMPGYEMKNLNSKSLNRKFDRIIFSGGLSSQQEVVMSPEAIKKAHKGVNMDAAMARASQGEKPGSAKPVKGKPAKVTKAKGANAYTVAELWANRAKLEKKNVVIRGRVVKVASRILKKNWLHIEDGTGSAAKKTNELVVTTKTLPNEGDVVTVKGVLRNRIDFGAGYRYELIIMDGNVKGS